MITPEEFQKLKRRADEARSRVDQAKGQLEAALDSLRSEFGVSSLDEAKELLASIDREISEESDKFESSKKSFEEKYGPLL